MAKPLFEQEDLIDRKVGKLTFTGKFISTKGGRAWEAECECGNLTHIRSRYILEQKHLQCNSCALSYYTNVYPVRGRYMTALEANSRNRKKDIAVEVTLDDLNFLWFSQQGRCALTGVLLTLKTKSVDSDATASVDRKNSNGPYSVDNTQWVHKTINRAKMDLSEEEFINMCRQVVEFHDLEAV